MHEARAGDYGAVPDGAPVHGFPSSGWVQFPLVPPCTKPELTSYGTVPDNAPVHEVPEIMALFQIAPVHEVPELPGWLDSVLAPVQFLSSQLWRGPR